MGTYNTDGFGSQWCGLVDWSEERAEAGQTCSQKSRKYIRLNNLPTSL